MDLLGTGSIYFELIYKALDNSDCALDDILNVNFDPISDMAYLQEHASLEYRGIGGHAANVIYALSKLKYSVGFLGVVGKDETGNELLQQLHNVDTTLLRRFENSGLQISVFKGNEKIAAYSFSNSNQYLAFTEDDLEKIDTSKYIFIGPVDNANSLKSHVQMLSLISNELPVFFMPGKISASANENDIKKIISNSRVVFIAEDEMDSLSGITSAGFNGLLALGTHVVVCKAKDHIRIVSKHSDYTIPIKKTVLIDDSDYLDSFTAGFLSAYMEGYSLESCGYAGVQLSALTSTAYGRNAYPDFKFLKYLLPEKE